MYRYPISLLLMMASTQAYAAAFSSCPSEAFLFQGSPVSVSRLNLVTGSVSTLVTSVGVGESGNINAVGYNTSDNFIYGYSNFDKKIKKIGDGYQVEADYDVINLPDVAIPAGDVSANTYYLYKKGDGLYTVDLTDIVGGDMTANLISGSTSTRNFGDIAMHPSDGNLYTVDSKNGKVYQINTSTGIATPSGNSSVTGVFGAIFFDSAGVLYLLRNTDGAIFRIPDVTTATIATRYAKSSSVKQNDGVRCNQSIVPVTDLDFGDAPDTYGTSLSSGGARHDISSGLYYMGSANADAESDAELGTSDDVVNLNDEAGDGVSISTASVSMTAAVSVSVPLSSGYLNAWADWNQDGDFDANEQIFTGESLAAGSNTLLINVPSNDAMANQNIWMRFRYSSTETLSPTGGAPDGEVEDHSVLINAAPTNIYTFPDSGVYTAAFEDAWPQLYDYDLNDAVFNYKVQVLAEGSSVQQIKITGTIEAIGAAIQSGLALHFPDLLRSDIEESSILFRKKGVLQTTSPLESGQTNAVIIISDNAKLELSASCQSGFYRTDNDCQQDATATFEIVLPIKSTSTVSMSDFPSAPYDPFIYRSATRGIEIHAEDNPPTDLGTASTALFNTGADSSDITEGEYYRNVNNLPWGLIINGAWAHPREQTDLTEAYPNFSNYVLDELTSDDSDWFVESKRMSDKIYGSE
jgi:LruC domain-containing protein